MLSKVTEKLRNRQRANLIHAGKQNLERHGLLGSNIPSAPENALPPNYDDLWAVAKTVLDAKPRFVLEYGTGHSTFVIAEALRQLGGDRRLLSVESNQHWFDVTRNRLPAQLKPVIDLQYLVPEMRIFRSRVFGLKGAREGFWYKGRPKVQTFGLAVIVYPNLHDLTPDMIYLDGPDSRDVAGYHDDQGRVIRPIVADLMYQEKNLKPGFVMAVDSRRTNCAFLAENLSGQYRIDVNHIQGFTTFHKIA